MDKKTISINPKLFEVNKAGKGGKSEKKKPHGVIKPNTLKRQLMQKIKNHKKEKSNKHQEIEKGTEKENVKEIATEESEFNSAMKDLSNIVKNHKKTMKKPKMPPTGVPPLLQNNSSTVPPPATNNPVIHINLPSSLNEKLSNPPPAIQQKISNDTATKTTSENNVPPPYGCLKNGRKPTYKTWKNTGHQKPDNSANKITIVDTEPMESNEKNVGSFTYRQKRLEEIKRKLKAKEEDKQQRRTNMGHTPKKLKRTIKNTYTLGKKGKSVKVLIKNSHTRKNNQIEKNIIGQTDIKDMKLYLKNQGLMATGSTAPADVMREIFVSSKLAGDIENKNSDILINNYLATDS